MASQLYLYLSLLPAPVLIQRRRSNEHLKDPKQRRKEDGGKSVKEKDIVFALLLSLLRYRSCLSRSISEVSRYGNDATHNCCSKTHLTLRWNSDLASFILGNWRLGVAQKGLHKIDH